MPGRLGEDAMKVEEFAIAWHMSKCNAQSWLIHNRVVKKINGHYVYDPVDVAKGYQMRHDRMLPKQRDELDINDIKLTFGISRIELSNITNSDTFPEPKRLICEGGSNKKRLWDKKQVCKFFKEEKPVRKKRIITGIRADMIHFINGQSWKYGQAIHSNFKHYNEWRTME